MSTIKYTLLFLIGICFLYACTDITYTDDIRTIEEGIGAKVKLSVKSNPNEIITKSTSSEADEKMLHNMYVLIFNGDGSRLFGRFYDRSEIEKGDLIIDTYSGRNKTVYAVANLGLGMMSLNKEQLEQVRKLEDLQVLNAELLQQTLTRGSNFLMSGFIADSPIKGPKTVDIYPGDQTAQSLGTIYLKRLDAKIQFNIATKEGVKFEASEWRVVQAPAFVFTYPNDKRNQFTSDNQYFNSKWMNMEGEGEMQGKTFSFYILENRNAPKKLIPASGDVGADYALREKQEKEQITSTLPGQTVQNGAFVYAPQHGTYVQFKGRISYKDTDSKNIDGDVIYTVHLGYVKSIDGNGIVNDYDIDRNTYYSYNVKIESANSIKLEVESTNPDEEKQPGAEGDLTIDGQVLRFDSHFETTTIEFDKKLDKSYMDWSVHTPFSKGQASSNPIDYKWIYFKLSPKDDSNAYLNTFSAFPGLENVFSGESVTVTDLLENTGKLLDIKQLISVLKDSQTNPKLYDTTGRVRFTVFVHENYYEKDPNANLSPENLLLWKRFVNREDRVMNIIYGVKYSADGQSSLTHTYYSFRQASIQTMYNPELSDDLLKTAWGTEMFQDKQKYEVDKNNTIAGISTSANDGRTNTINLWKVNSDSKWNTYVDSPSNSMKKGYNYARYACMQRNRDLNGNGKIDKSEVRWYMASINQLTDLWLGERSFNQEASLYKKEDAINYGKDWKELWFVSSTLNGSQPMVLWSAEGSSIGRLDGVPTQGREKLVYRCVRNLGIKADDLAVPEDFVKTEHMQENEVSFTRISLDKLNYKSIRGHRQIIEQIEHDERSPENLPYWSFDVYRGTHGEGLNWYDVKLRASQGNSPCPIGWRVPNQRELSYMLSRLGNDGGWRTSWWAGIWEGRKDFNHMSRTAFSQDPDPLNTKGRPGFAVRKSAEILFMINSADERGGVRCVRDGVQK